MKKMKKVVSLEASPYAVYEDARTRLKHQSLMQDYEELDKETDAMKNRLKVMEQKKLTLLAEVRFLKRRYKYLTEKQPMNQQMKRGHSQEKSQNYENRSTSIAKKKTQSKKESAFRYPAIPLDLNQKERTYNGMEAPLQKPPPFLDLNQKVRTLNGKEVVPLQNSRPMFDLNQQERIHSGKEAAKRKNAPYFDLNQISGEEEEFQANKSEPLKGLLRNANTEEQHNDMKLLVCRNIGNGSNRAGKRKITWQDQVALRV
ncbi:hypothetical protein L484_004168 [Morus notabilis]|uniref:Uncharacterized protein n=1 Tax=Morus notabilis TaxID=981085 RepID=W9QLE3_9ROSA|nr:uncharacterized protein LOC21387674 [Morus notabilis]EXB24579.1 hypothetical protein L484_004168 [Morus notabilis]